MDGMADTDFGLIAETASFLCCFSSLPDSRQAGKIVYPLNEVLLLSLLAVLAGGGEFRRDGAVRRKEAEIAAPVSALCRRDAAARHAGRHLRHAGRRSVPALLRRLGRRPDQDACRGHRHRRQDRAQTRPCADREARPNPRRRSIWSRLSPRGNASCWRRPR